VTLVETLELPDLTNEQIEQLCLIAEKAARDHLLSRVRSKDIESMDISARAEGAKPLELEVEVGITLSSQNKHVDVQKLADEAVKKAFSSAERRLKALACRSRK
jgi:GGDEF domain-containing protein